jgi:hypothetical protein
MALQETSAPGEFQCDLCGEYFDSVTDLNKHKEGYHERPGRQTRTENLDIQRDIGAAGLPGAPQV